MTPKEMEQEIENLEYMASGSTYDHQVETKNALLRKADTLKQILTELKQTR